MNDKRIEKILKRADLEDIVQTFNSAIEICVYSVPEHDFEWDGDYVIWKIYHQALLDAAEVVGKMCTDTWQPTAIGSAIAEKLRQMAEDNEEQV